MPEGRKRIFAIDDDSSNLAEITGLLRDDYDVWTATCGEDAVEFSTPGTTFYLDTRSAGDRITFRLSNPSYDVGGRDPDEMFVFPSPKIVEGEVVGAGIHMALVRR